MDDSNVKKLNLGKDVEDNVIDQLDKSAKMDEVDTITFGLETDDGKIVKVYVNAEQADDFEKALSQKLGEVDDIEQCLNDLTKEFEIVDVEWPDEESEDEDSEDEEDDGSDVMDQKVYNNDKEKASKERSLKPKFESKRKHTFRSQLLDESQHGTIESRMTTPMQLLVYHAIVELGVPTIALDRSPYKSTIIADIKRRANDLNKFPTLKTALKIFIHRVHGLESEHQIKDEMCESMDIAAYIAESVVEDFWGCVTRIIQYLAPDAKHANDFMKTSKFKTLVSRSHQAIPENVKSDLRMKLQKLGDALESHSATVAADAAPKISESITPDNASQMLSNIFTIVDPTATKSLSKMLLNSPEFKTYFTSIKPTLSQKFGGVMSQKMIDFCKALDNAVGEEQPKGPQQPNQAGTQPPNGTNPSTGSQPTVESMKVLKESIDWTFDKNDDGYAVASTDGITMTLDDEQFEKAVKAINMKNVIVVKDAENPRQKYTLSPRGTILVVKKMGDNVSYQMSGDQMQDFMELISDDTESDEKDASDGDKKSDKPGHDQKKDEKSGKKDEEE